MNPIPPVAPPYSRAHELACEIENLLTNAARAAQGSSEGYSVRLAQAITRSLIDQLDELGTPASSAARLKTHQA